MAVLEREIISPPELPRHVFTRREYYKMGRAGFFDDQKVEMIEGDIIQLPPPGPPHRSLSLELYNIFYGLFGREFYVMHESPVVLSNTTEPLPDVSVVRGSVRNYRKRHPHYDDVLLAVEVSDSTLSKDRNLKQRLYAAKGIAEYWIVNVVQGHVEVYREPKESTYSQMTVCRSGDTIATLFKPDVPIAVDDFLSLLV
jgi:Uma2 family endonuclease